MVDTRRTNVTCATTSLGLGILASDTSVSAHTASTGPALSITTRGETIVNFNGPDESDTPSRAEDGPADGADVATQPTAATTAQESPTSPARLLEIAAVTADRLVADAKTEAESLVTAARGEADAVLEASRSEARRVEAELVRNKEQQTADLERERATALTGLADEKAALEQRIAALRQMQTDHRRQLRDHLEEQLSRLDAVAPQPPGAADV